MLRVGIEEAVIGQHLSRVAGRFKDDRGNVELVEPDMQIASSSSRASLSGQNSAPCAIIASPDAGGGAAGPRTRMVAIRAARSSSTGRVPYSIASSAKLRESGVSLMPAPEPRGLTGPRIPWRGLRSSRRISSPAPRHRPAAIRRRVAFDAFLGGAKHVGMVAADPPLVGDAGEPAGAGQHRQQRQFRQRYRRRTVVDEHDVIGRQRQLVTAAGRGAVDRADRFDARILAKILDAIAGLVGELAEIHLMRVARASEHANIGARRKHPWFGRAQHQHPRSGMFEAQPLDRVG